jgi:2-hydroxychromene-2-carboxylate isomerase
LVASEQPIFYYDLGSPYAYLAAERIQRVLPVVPIWQPILVGGIWKETGGRSWATTDKRAQGMAEIERRAAKYGLLPVRWPAGWPNNTLSAMRAAVFRNRPAGRWRSPWPRSARRSRPAETYRMSTTS